MICLLARGHILLEGLPGLGKTELVKVLASLLGLEFRRVQFTPDLLPGDIVGSPILEDQGGTRKLAFHRGPVFANLVLADEINRATPKTQSALLEAMQEQRVTVMGESHALPRPFFVLATQNPIELEGTYPLPEAQLDRFTFKINVESVSSATLEEIISTRKHGRAPQLSVVVSAVELDRLFELTDMIHLPTAVANYIARLVHASHPKSETAPDEVRRFVRFGASPRAAIALAETARGSALLAGRPNVSFDDVRRVTASVLQHRLLLDYAARLEGWTTVRLIDRLLETVPQIDRSLPGDSQGVTPQRPHLLPRLLRRERAGAVGIVLALVAAVGPIPACGSGDERTTNADDLTIRSDTRWAGGGEGGYLPIRVRVTNHGKPRDLTFEFESYGEGSNVRVRRAIGVDQNATVHFTLSVPLVESRDGTLHVYEGSRPLQGHQRSISVPSALYLSPSPPAMLVVSPVTVDCARFVDMGNHKSGTTASPRYGYGYGRGTIDASVLANVVPSDLLPESWIDYSGLDYLAIPRDELERLEHPVRAAILKWVQSGGSLLVYDVGKDADALARLDRLIEGPKRRRRRGSTLSRPTDPAARSR